ncbi:ATP synthase F1 subunit delta, partial [Klebsiella quasipneumoniae]
MSEFVTVARPYAKAAFDFAVEHNSVERWQDMLAFAAEVTKNDQMAELLSGALAPETLSEAFIAICADGGIHRARNHDKRTEITN